MTEYALGEIPPEPENDAVVVDREGKVWQRFGAGWVTPGGTVRLFGPSDGVKTWTRLLVENGPLRELVPAETAGAAAANRTLRDAWNAVAERDPDAASGWSLGDLPDAIRSMCTDHDSEAYTLRRDLIELLGDQVGWSDPSDDEIVAAVTTLKSRRDRMTTWTAPTWATTHEPPYGDGS